MVTLTRIAAANYLKFKSVRLAALLDSPTAFGSTYANESKLTDADWLKRVDTWTTPTSIGLLAMEADEPCGIVAGFLKTESEPGVHLISMWVAPTHRRTGVGRSLIKAVIDWAVERKAKSLLLMVTSSNTSAFCFYKKLGFERTGRTEPYPNDPNLVEYEMSRPI